MNSTSRSRIMRHARCRVRADIPLAPLTSFQIGGPAALLAEPATIAELVELFRLIGEEQAAHFYLGLGTNLLVSDAGIDAVVVRASGDLTGIRSDAEVLHAGPGARLLDLTTHAAVRALSGIEPLSGIPGTVGGGLYMNAGAYGGEIADTFVSADVLSPDLTTLTVEKRDVGFSYRSAPAFRDVIVLNSRYRLARGEQAKIIAEMRRVWKLRRAKQPLEFPSAGSIFKRPPNDFAGRLIEAVDGKGVRVGGALVPHKHAGMFVNTGGATAADVCALVREIRSRVYREFHILLETEVLPIGFKEDPFAIAL
ncbi:UDP-N-acetylmuramate dehydrogenase [candidate division KSB1 bacterium]|nr:UDP-N-acetylmuramate dehydrogenase [candidate division KSB1 bacterium]